MADYFAGLPAGYLNKEQALLQLQPQQHLSNKSV
jgi:hypothetical protein